jgi:hypothetical protein
MHAFKRSLFELPPREGEVSGGFQHLLKMGWGMKNEEKVAWNTISVAF